jgi:tetratricopeptide (TPR) repeat protein
MDSLQQQLRELRLSKNWDSGSDLLSEMVVEELEPETQHEVARFYFGAKKYDKTQDILLKLAEAQPDKRSVFSDLGMVFERQGAFDKAADFYDAASLLGGEKYKEKANECRVLFESQQHNKADAPIEADADYNKAETLYRQKQYLDAYDACLKSIQNFKNNQNQILLLKILFTLHKDEAALSLADKLKSEGVENFEIEEITGTIHMQAFNLDKALPHLERSVELNPGLVSVLGALGRLNYLKKNYDAARIWIDKGLSKRSKVSEWWACSGRIHIDKGNYEAAEKDFEKEEKLAKSGLSALNLACVYLLQGKDDLYYRYTQAAQKRSFDFEHLRKEGSRTLFVSLAPNFTGFVLKKFPFPGDTLLLKDNTGSYFTYNADLMVNLICDLLAAYSYKRVAFIGFSKGGTGALIASSLLSKLYPDLDIKCLALSPQINIWPYNPNLNMPSYRALMERVQGNILFKSKLELFGDVNAVTARSAPNNDMTVIYGDGYAMDKTEISCLNNKQVKLFPLRFSGHNTLMALTIPKGFDKEAVRRKYSSMKSSDNDSEYLAAENEVSMVDEMIEIQEKHSLSRLIDAWGEPK